MTKSEQMANYQRLPRSIYRSLSRFANILTTKREVDHSCVLRHIYRNVTYGIGRWRAARSTFPA